MSPSTVSDECPHCIAVQYTVWNTQQDENQSQTDTPLVPLSMSTETENAYVKARVVCSVTPDMLAALCLYGCSSAQAEIRAPKNSRDTSLV